jgi:hypothetical protein
MVLPLTTAPAAPYCTNPAADVPQLAARQGVGNGGFATASVADNPAQSVNSELTVPATVRADNGVPVSRAVFEGDAFSMILAIAMFRRCAGESDHTRSYAPAMPD